VTAWREDGTAVARGQLRTSRADREQAVDVLQAAFVQGRLTKDEFELRVGQALASRTYADLAALTADIPAGVASARPEAEPARGPGMVLSFKTVARVSAVGASPSMAFTALMVQARGVPAVAGVILVGLTGLLAAGLLAVLLTVLAWAAQRSRRRHAQGPPSGPAGPAIRRQPPDRQLPSGRRDPWHLAEASRSGPPRVRARPVQGCGA